MVQPAYVRSEYDAMERVVVWDYDVVCTYLLNEGDSDRASDGTRVDLRVKKDKF